MCEDDVGVVLLVFVVVGVVTFSFVLLGAFYLVDDDDGGICVCVVL